MLYLPNDIWEIIFYKLDIIDIVSLIEIEYFYNIFINLYYNTHIKNYIKDSDYLNKVVNRVVNDRFTKFTYPLDFSYSCGYNHIYFCKCGFYNPNSKNNRHKDNIKIRFKYSYNIYEILYNIIELSNKETNNNKYYKKYLYLLNDINDEKYYGFEKYNVEKSYEFDFDEIFAYNYTGDCGDIMIMKRYIEYCDGTFENDEMCSLLSYSFELMIILETYHWFNYRFDNSNKHKFFKAYLLHYLFNNKINIKYIDKHPCQNHCYPRKETYNDYINNLAKHNPNYNNDFYFPWKYDYKEDSKNFDANIYDPQNIIKLLDT